jgi:hypothetical protein
MPWYIALILFILAPAYTILVKDKLWPKLQDWWAGRSRASLQKRIQKLETALGRIDSLPVLTEFEDMVMRGLFGVLVLLTILPPLALFAFLAAFTGLNSGLALQTYSEIVFTLLTFVFVFMGVGIAQTLITFRQERSLAYRKTVRKHIDELQARLPVPR